MPARPSAPPVAPSTAAARMPSSPWSVAFTARPPNSNSTSLRLAARSRPRNSLRLIVRSSGIHAAGCFAQEPIRKGQKVVEYTGERMLHDDADKLFENLPYTYLF